MWKPHRAGAVALFTLFIAVPCRAAQPIIENERVTIWDVAWSSADPAPVPHHPREFVTVYLIGSTDGTHRKGDVIDAVSGDTKLRPGERAVVIELKDPRVPPLVNESGYPNAFPRPRSEKVLETNRVVVWRYAFRPGEPSPMHFHDKDAIPIYMEATALKSTTPDGVVTENDYRKFETRFSPRNRTHTEVLVRGTGSAIITELK